MFKSPTAEGSQPLLANSKKKKEIYCSNKNDNIKTSLAPKGKNNAAQISQLY